MTRLDAFARVKLAPGAQLPEYKTEGASGMDLCAHVTSSMDLSMGDGRLIATGVYIELPDGLEAQIRPRSSLSLFGIMAAFGTIDCDYRGEIKVCLWNIGPDKWTLNPGDRVAQLVIAPVVRCRLQVVDELDDTARGSGGFGSTGVR